jgi:hypothetical protein
MPATVKRPPGPEVTRHFKIHSLGAMKAFKSAAPDGSPAMYLEGIASSTVRDRHGDTITANAQAQMLEAAKGLTMWLNHSYNVPEDILGTCEESSLVSGTDADGSDCLDLTIRCRIDAANPRAVKTWQHIENGTQLGFSIGGEITQCEVDEENDDGMSWCPPLIIDGLALYEISCVGIPANPRAYTRSFVQEMSRGFMRTVSRDRGVRELVMKQFANRHASEDDVPFPIDLDAAEITPEDVRNYIRDVGRKAVGEQLKSMMKSLPATADRREHLLLAIATKAFDEAPHEPIEGEAKCAHVDGCGEMNAAGSMLCAAHMAANQIVKSDGEDDPMPAKEVHAKAVSALKCLTLSMGHGMCTEGMAQTQAAHDIVKSLLPEDYVYPEDEDPATGTDDDDVSNAVIATTQKVAALTAQADEIEKALAEKRTELEQVSTAVQQRTDEVKAAEATLAQLTTDKDELQKTISQLNATPTGRQTGQAGGSTGRAGSYQKRTARLSDAQANLSAKLAGVSLDSDPALRPA